jgi:hypothetical protein
MQPEMKSLHGWTHGATKMRKPRPYATNKILVRRTERFAAAA